MRTVLNPPPKDKYLALHEAMMRDAGIEDVEDLQDEADITAELRSIGSILSPVSLDQRKQLDMLGSLQPTIRKQSRRVKKSARK